MPHCPSAFANSAKALVVFMHRAGSGSSGASVSVHSLGGEMNIASLPVRCYRE